MQAEQQTSGSFLEKRGKKRSFLHASRIDRSRNNQKFFASFFQKRRPSLVSPADDSGFTLLEVLVAFVIAALAMGALYGGTVSGLDATAVAAKYDEAVSLARSHIAAIGRGEPIALQEHSGAEGEGFTWHLRIRRHASRVLSLTDQDRANDVKPASAILYDITVTESWKAGGRERQVTLATRKFDVIQEAGGQ